MICGLLLAHFTPHLLAIETIESSFDHLQSDDFRISLFTIRSSQNVGSWQTKATLSGSDYDLHFQPASFDFLGRETQIKEQTYSLNIDASRQFHDSLSLELALGYRDGFPNYRTVWLDTYFDQHYAPLEGVPGHELYQDFDASAASLSAGLRWEYSPANATAYVSVSRTQDNVSPGYEIDFDGIRRGELVLATTSVSLITENVITERIRSRFALTATETSAREMRYAAEYAVNTALGEHFIWRNKLGASIEDPQFEAYFFDTALKFQAHENLSVFLSARRYEDTGEIENALLFTTAAPSVESDSIGFGLRYAGDLWSARFSATHSRSDFEETNQNVDFFQNLYADDDWLTLQIALAKAF